MAVAFSKFYNLPPFFEQRDYSVRKRRQAPATGDDTKVWLCAKKTLFFKTFSLFVYFLPVESSTMDCFYCGEICHEMCTDCNSYAYCSESHREFHKDQDSGACLPFKILKNEEFGRFMVATKDIKPFEPVVVDEALAIGPCDDSQPCCLGCLSPVLDCTTYVHCPVCNLPMCKVSCHLFFLHHLMFWIIKCFIIVFS